MERGISWRNAQPDIRVVDVAFSGFKDDVGCWEISAKHRGEIDDLRLCDVKLGVRFGRAHIVGCEKEERQRRREAVEGCAF